MLIEDYKKQYHLADDFDFCGGKESYWKAVTFGNNYYTVKITLGHIIIDDCIYDRIGDNIIDHIKNAVLEHNNWCINSNELKALKEWDGIIY